MNTKVQKIIDIINLTEENPVTKRKLCVGEVKVPGLDGLAVQEKYTFPRPISDAKALVPLLEDGTVTPSHVRIDIESDREGRRTLCFGIPSSTSVYCAPKEYSSGKKPVTCNTCEDYQNGCPLSPFLEVMLR